MLGRAGVQELPWGLGSTPTPQGLWGMSTQRCRGRGSAGSPGIRRWQRPCVPGQGHPEGWKGLGEEQAPPGLLRLLLPGRSGIPQTCQAGRGTAGWSRSPGFRWLDPPGSRGEQRGRGHSRGPAVPPSPELADVNMAFVPRSSPAPLPPAQRFQPGPGTRDERGSSSPGTEGKGGRSRLSLQGCSYHQQSPAPAGNGTGHCPQARQVSWGARASPRQLPKCWDEERGPGPASSAG